jgi:replicative DNA helicase Mcm
VNISDIRHEQLGKLICISGIVKRVSEVKPLILKAAFKCARCPTVIVESQNELYIKEPLECYKEQNGCGRSAGSTQFSLVPNECIYSDYQKIDIQETPESLRGGKQPTSLSCYVLNNLVGKILPGERVTLNGIIELDRMKEKSELSIVDIRFRIISYNHTIEDYDDLNITEEDEAKIRKIASKPKAIEYLVDSFAPSIYGVGHLKEAVIYQLFGGTRKTLADGRVTRGESHILICGDPGIAKTALGMYAATVAPRGMFASGKSSSAAGLTAAVVKDTMKKDSWAFEIGVLPKADGGVAIIDEIDKMRPEDVSSMNEALESQHISLNKAGVSVTISTRTAVLGLCNPKYGRFDPNEDMMEQVNMNDTLLSRFDLIFLEKDRPLNGLDESICDQILDNHRGVVTKNDDIIDTELFRKYIAMGKKLNPTLSNEASDLIKKHYLSNRKKSGNDGVMKITARQLEAFIRLSEASARVRLSDTITAEDARRAINLFSLAMSKISTDGDVDVVMSGVGKKTRNALSDIKEMFRCAPNGMLKEVELLAQCEAKGICSDEMDKCVEKLRYKGDLIMPRRGTYQLDDRR